MKHVRMFTRTRLEGKIVEAAEFNRFVLETVRTTGKAQTTCPCCSLRVVLTAVDTSGLDITDERYLEEVR